ncbi:MobA/MobL family protein [Xanthomonas phaseoli]|uniref:MobA/MobL family protein n=3 Tax=Xanthomonas phaseoli TaxID=1985254 RepID=UPI001237A96F|nr:MobA/MobL family protein [Xanthomonas phaseoli]MBO9834667.1 MobA/MobL family protein [Xanthomonas phaseoli pv. dieffenbachiae]MBO9838970.1 MobA/MobL family protein [Xanthomonas phaseoli pv. dieffenbachiae]MBO9842938.1 MobA/MobL family protein [Xanthomonas phaseoli pv. dieffenbachiae]MBO9863558.1 MobA/MobL family protein [Xanthomonas phaseoli pv. dieffenbachiae]MBO9867192.1 MobA/MobL family protein [Xanthomonas phaseoli pv. dieffenbachiae]
MAIYHANVKTFSRAKGHSSIAAAAYRAGLLLEDEKTGQRHDYRRRDGVVETRCIAPEDAPDWALVPAQLWPAAEAAERRKDSTVAREFEFALPHELDDLQRSDLAVEVTRALVSRYGFAAQASIHSPGSKDGLNWHVHVLATTRRMGPDGLTDKTKELDGGPSGRVEVQWVRELIASTTNAHLEKAALEIRVDHRSLEAQASDALARGDLAAAAILSREPTKHVGKNGTALARRGQPSERFEANQLIEETNETTFKKLVAAFEQEGRAMPVPDGHNQAQAEREARRPSDGLSLPLGPGAGRIEVSRSMATLARGLGLMEAKPPREPRSVAELAEEANDEWGVAVQADPRLAQTLQSTLALLQWIRERVTAFAEEARLRPDLNELLRRLRRFKAAAMKFARRLLAGRRAEKLHHMAENAWHDFLANNPEPGTSWTHGDWKQRRGRRLNTLEARAAELADARARVTSEEQALCKKEASASAAHLEAWSRDMLQRYPLQLDMAIEPDQPRSSPAISAPPAPTYVPKPPRFH